jgi:pimeloyl-ACP methyl ester carboxylesterase
MRSPRHCAAAFRLGAIVLGWSLGGMAALARERDGSPLTASRAAPASISRLILVASTPCFVARAGLAARAWRPAVLEGFAQRLRTDYACDRHDFLDLQLRGSRKRACDAARPAGGARVPRQRFRRTRLRPDSSFCARRICASGFGGIDLPALVVAGQYDRVTHPARGGRWPRRCRGRISRIRRTGHAPMLSHPKQNLPLKSSTLRPNESMSSERPPNHRLNWSDASDRPALQRRERALTTAPPGSRPMVRAELLERLPNFKV